MLASSLILRGNATFDGTKIHKHKSNTHTIMAHYRRLLLGALTLVLGALFIISCRRTARVGFTEVDLKHLPTCDYLVVDYPLNVTVHVGAQTAVAFDEKMPKRIREDIEVKVKDNILLISSRHERTGVDPFDDVQRGKSAHIDVYLPKLLGVEATYAANISVPDSLRQSSFSVVLSGASDLTDLHLTADSLSVSTAGASGIRGWVNVAKNLEIISSGASSIRLSGQADYLSVSLSGACDFRAEQLHTRAVEALLAGASRLDLGNVDTISYGVSGASNLRYQGQPVVIGQVVTGASTVNSSPAN